MSDERSIGMVYVPGQSKLDDHKYAELLKADWEKRSEVNASLYTCAVPNASSDVIAHSGRVDYDKYFTPPGLGRTTKRKTYKVLEYGCGIGRMTQFIAGDVGSVTAVDISYLQLDKAKDRTKDLDNIEFILGDGMTLSEIDSDQYNYIFSYLVFQHIGSKSIIEGILREFNRVSKSTGRMKLQFRDVGIPEDNNSGNTWHGAKFGKADLERFAKEYSWEIESLTGEGTEYLWVEMKKA